MNTTRRFRKNLRSWRKKRKQTRARRGGLSLNLRKNRTKKNKRTPRRRKLRGG